MVREERRSKAEADVKAMTARVAQLTSQYEAQLAQLPQSSRGGGALRYPSRGLDEVGSLESSDLNIGAGRGVQEGSYRFGIDRAQHGSRDWSLGEWVSAGMIVGLSAVTSVRLRVP